MKSKSEKIARMQSIVIEAVDQAASEACINAQMQFGPQLGLGEKVFPKTSKMIFEILPFTQIINYYPAQFFGTVNKTFAFLRPSVQN